MSLLTQKMEACQMLTPTRADDGLGGYKDTWVGGAKFKAAIAKDSSPELTLAEKQGISESFTVVVDQAVTLEYHDVFKRLSDNSVFRVTGRTTDLTAHPASTVKIAKVTAERWVLPA